MCNLKIKVFVALSQILRVQSLFNAQEFSTSITVSVFSLYLIMFCGTYSLLTPLKWFLKMLEPFLYRLQKCWKSSECWCTFILVYLFFQLMAAFFKILYLSSGITSFKYRLSELRETKRSPSKRFFIFNFLKFLCSRKVPSIILKGLSEIGVKMLLKMQASRKFWSF